jgi:plastocyanin
MTDPMRKTMLASALLIGGLSAITFAADTAIHQKGRLFSPDVMTVKKGEALTFLNDDNLPHNIMSASPGNEFNLGSQVPGSATPVTFKQAGEVKVICAIHPRMKMNVTVTD